MRTSSGGRPFLSINSTSNVLPRATRSGGWRKARSLNLGRAPYRTPLDHLFQIQPFELPSGLDNHRAPQRGRARLRIGFGLFEKLDAARQPVLQGREAALDPLRDLDVTRAMSQRKNEVAASAPDEHGDQRQGAHDAD